MPHNPAFIVRSLYGERTAEEKTTLECFSQSCQQQFDTRSSHRSRPPFENAISALVVKIDRSCTWFLGHYLSSTKRVLNPKQVLAVRCPTCGAPPQTPAASS